VVVVETALVVMVVMMPGGQMDFLDLYIKMSNRRYASRDLLYIKKPELEKEPT
jgi:hypothetical protein